MAATPANRPRAEAFGTQVSRAANAFVRGLRANSTQPDPLALERQRQHARYSAALANYRRRLAALRTQLVAGGTVAVGGAAFAASSLDGMPTEAPIAVIGGSAAVLGAWHALRGRRGLKQLSQPMPPLPVVALPAPLPPGSPGADSAMRVSGLRAHIMTLLPALEQLQPQAADDVRAADAATAPGLNALVERMRSMQRIIDEMPGSTAAGSSRLGIQALRIRLDEGANAYQELLTAVIELSSATAVTGGPQVTVRPAVNELRAYAAGLAAVERTWV